MPDKIDKWKDIEKEYGGAILLGNGASIAVDSGFSYGSLKQHATGNGWLSEGMQNIFDFFHTEDFELILRIVWQATNVNHDNQFRSRDPKFANQKDKYGKRHQNLPDKGWRETTPASAFQLGPVALTCICPTGESCPIAGN